MFGCFFSQKKLALFWLVWILFLLGQGGTSSAKGHPFPRQITDQLQRKVVIPQKPQRIISTVPSNTEILLSLGLAKYLVGATNWCSYPSQNTQIKKIGELTPLNMEKIISLQPDLIIASVLNGRESLEKLIKLHIPLIIVNPQSFDGIIDSISLISLATGRQEIGGLLTNKLHKKLFALKKQGQNLHQKDLKIYIHLGHDSNWTAGPGSFLDEAITLAGGFNIAYDLTKPWGKLTNEVIIARNPDIILTDTPPGNLYHNPLYQNIAAVKKKQVYQLITDQFYRPGPALIDSLPKLVEIIKESH